MLFEKAKYLSALREKLDAIADDGDRRLTVYAEMDRWSRHEDQILGREMWEATMEVSHQCERAIENARSEVQRAEYWKNAPAEERLKKQAYDRIDQLLTPENREKFIEFLHEQIDLDPQRYETRLMKNANRRIWLGIALGVFIGCIIGAFLGM